MSDRPDFISGIYNYCDYICKNCVNTDKCYLYWSERHPEEAEKDFDKTTERIIEEFGEDVFEIDEEWEEPYEEKLKREQERERSMEIIKPAEEIYRIALPLLREIGDNVDPDDKSLDTALDNIASNCALISAKYYRAVHGMPEYPKAEINMGDYYGLDDSEKTFLAMKGFIWNLKSGCTVLSEKMPEYSDKCRRLIELADLIFDRIENEHLPVVQTLIEKNRERFDEDE